MIGYKFLVLRQNNYTTHISNIKIRDESYYANLDRLLSHAKTGLQL